MYFLSSLLYVNRGCLLSLFPLRRIIILWKTRIIFRYYSAWIKGSRIVWAVTYPIIAAGYSSLIKCARWWIIQLQGEQCSCLSYSQMPPSHCLSGITEKTGRFVGGAPRGDADTHIHCWWTIFIVKLIMIAPYGKGPSRQKQLWLIETIPDTASKT